MSDLATTECRTDVGHHRLVPTETDLTVLLRSLAPRRDERSYVFVTVPQAPADVDAVATVREDEGVTLVVDRRTADAHGWDYGSAMARVTLSVYSDLEAVGLTAAVASALARAGISANMVAGYHHDHVFVPERDADQAVEVLSALSAGSAASSRADTSPGSDASASSRPL
jgi:uncharacterized protein